MTEKVRVEVEYDVLKKIAQLAYKIILPQVEFCNDFARMQNQALDNSIECAEEIKDTNRISFFSYYGNMSGSKREQVK